MCKVLHEGQRRNLYLTIPDWYVLNGQACTGMGYREATDNIDIVLQTVIYRQYIFDATLHKTAGMGWVNLNTEVLHGGMEQNLDKYERIFFTMLSSGAQVWVRGHRLYDGPQSQAMLKKWMDWYRRYRAIIQGDIIHLRRPDGRDLDYYLHVNPANQEKGMLLVFNPLDEAGEEGTHRAALLHRPDRHGEDPRTGRRAQAVHAGPRVQCPPAGGNPSQRL